MKSLLEVTDGQTLTTYWDAIFCMYTHMTGIWNISYMSLTFDVIRGHQRPNLYIWRSNLNDNTQRCMYTHKTNKNDVIFVNLSSKTIKSPWRSLEVTRGQVLTTSIFFLLLYAHGRHKKYRLYEFGLGGHKSLVFELRSVKIKL